MKRIKIYGELVCIENTRGKADREDSGHFVLHPGKDVGQVRRGRRGPGPPGGQAGPAPISESPAPKAVCYFQESQVFSSKVLQANPRCLTVILGIPREKEQWAAVPNPQLGMLRT